MVDNLEVQRHRLRRLRILQQLYNNRPEQMGDGILYQILKGDPELDPTPVGVRRSLDYLADRKFVSITKRGSSWLVKITADGVDYLEGDDPGLPGISHPDEFLNN